MSISFEQLPEQQQEPTTSTERIEDSKLANVIGYAVKEHVESAMKAMDDGRFEDAMGGLALADTVEAVAEAEYSDTSRSQFGGNKEVYSQYPTVEGESLLEKEVQMTIDALFEKYKMYKGVKKEDFKLIGKTVMYTATKGIDLSNPEDVFDLAPSWDSIMKDPRDKRFVMEIDGRTVDTRVGMTYELYEALIQAKKDAGEDPPDKGAHVYSTICTLLTGEEPYPLDAPTASVSIFGHMIRGRNLRGYDSDDFHAYAFDYFFRPTVELTTPDLR